MYSISKTNNNGEFLVSVKIPMDMGWIHCVSFCIDGMNFSLDHLKNENGYSCFSNVVKLSTKALYHYYFSFMVNNKKFYMSKDSKIVENISFSDMDKLSVNFEVPDWVKGKVMYHIFVDRFNKGKNDLFVPMKNRNIYNSFNDEMMIGPDSKGIWNNDFYGGNIEGIIEKLPYIKSLGVSIIYLSPIMLSQSNHRYDTSDYSMFDPYVGSNDDLKRLCDKAHSMGINVILDAVFNHTGNDSKYFNEYGNYNELGAFQSCDSKYYPFYRKHHFNNNTYFDYWWGMKNLPVCDSSSLEWQEYICGNGGIIDLWFSMGIDGLRLDVADELSDEFIYKIRETVKRNKDDGFILGEVWKNPMRMNRGYLSSGKGMDSVMNYPLADALIRYYKYSDVYKLSDVLKQIVNEYPDDTINSLMNFTSTHDISRAIDIFSSNEFNYYGEWAWDLNNNDRLWQKNYKLTDKQYNYGKSVYKSYIYSLAFLPGVLSIFYGDEVGLEGIGNLSNRKPFPWNSYDYDMLDYFKYIGKIRNRESFLCDAKLNVIDINNDYFMFERNGKDESMLVTVNRTYNNLNIKYPNVYSNYDFCYSLNNSSIDDMRPLGGLVLKKKK